MIQAFRFIEISKYDDGGQLTTRGQLMQGSSNGSVTLASENNHLCINSLNIGPILMGQKPTCSV